MSSDSGEPTMRLTHDGKVEVWKDGAWQKHEPKERSSGNRMPHNRFGSE